MAVQIYDKRTPPAQMKTLTADVGLVLAWYDTDGWVVEAFTRGATSLDESLNAVIDNNRHLDGHAVMSTKIGGTSSVRKIARVSQPPAPAATITTEDIPDP